jgi:hypothetical protein
MIELTKQYVTLDSGNTVLVEADATENGQIFYNVDCPSGITSEEYEQAINKVSTSAERVLRSKALFG